MFNAYIIAGGTGFVGTALVQKLIDQNKKVYVLTRQIKTSNQPLLTYVQWDTDKKTIAAKIHETGTCIINLAGANVADGRWTNERKKEILKSRTQSAETIEQLLAEKYISADFYFGASAIGFYGSPNKPCTEDMHASNDFLGTTCKTWEDASTQLSKHGLKICIGRIGLVMGNEGGALPELMNSFQFRVAAVPGNGKQIYSWIHIQDLCNAILHLCDNKLIGTYNLVAPKPTTAKDFIKAIATALNKFSIMLPIPKLALQIVLGEFSIELLKSVEVSNAKLLTSGFRFTYVDITSCMQNLVGMRN
jgi:uncharacterized protein